MRNLLKKKYPEIKMEWAGGNIGFARANNKMIHQALSSGAEYIIFVNPDMIFEPDFISEMVTVADNDKRIGAIAPKILKWDFNKNKKTNVIDSCGLYVTPEHRFSDIMQGEADNNDKPIAEVFGFTGGAALLRLNALRDIVFKTGGKSEHFDELMFMYKEDCDLSYLI